MTRARRCYCQLAEPHFCVDCDRRFFPLSDDEVGDVLSALSYFCDEYPDRKGSVETRKAMERISKKLWKMKRYERK